MKKKRKKLMRKDETWTPAVVWAALELCALYLVQECRWREASLVLAELANHEDTHPDLRS